MLQYSHYSKAIEDVLYNKRGSIRVEKWLYCMPIVLVLLPYSLHIISLGRIINCVTIRYRRTLKTHEFRTKDFFVR